MWSVYECTTAVFTNEILQQVQMQVDDVDSRGRAGTNVVSGNSGRCAAYTNVGQPWVSMRLCNASKCRSVVLTAYEQRIRMQESRVYQRASATCTNAGRRCRRQTNSVYVCRTAVGSNEVLQRVRTQVDDVDGRRAACTNVASGNGGSRAACTNVRPWCVPTRFCNAYECRSVVLNAYEQRIRMFDSSTYHRASATCTNAGRRCRRQTSSTYECRTAVPINKALQRVRTQVSDVNGS